MTVTLWINWEERKVLTTEEMDTLLDKAVGEAVKDERIFAETLEEYLDFNYTKTELFDILTSDSTVIKEAVKEIRDGTRETIASHCEEDILDNYKMMFVEV